MTTRTTQSASPDGWADLGHNINHHGSGHTSSISGRLRLPLDRKRESSVRSNHCSPCVVRNLLLRRLGHVLAHQQARGNSMMASITA